MTILGFCTHFSKADEWAFAYALRLARAQSWQLNICHWVNSPYKIRRDIIQDDLFNPKKNRPLSPELLTKLEFQLRNHYDQKLGDFTDVAFRLCEGQYQVELVRCFRKNLLDLVVMGYQTGEKDALSGESSLLPFAQKLSYPLVIVGMDGPGRFLLNSKALDWLQALQLPEDRWQVIESTPV